MHSSRRDFLCRAGAAGLALGLHSSVVSPGKSSDRSAAIEDLWTQVRSSARLAGYSLSKVQRWLHEKALPAIDAETGLYRADGHWDYRDTAADCYPFLCWAAFVTDVDALYGPILNVLHAEQQLCNHIGQIPVPFDWQTKAKNTGLPYEEIVFQASEYVKDGLIAIVEVTGKGEWFDRMKAIEENLWQRADVETAGGKICSTNVEVNGEQVQALARLFSMTGEERFLEWAERIGDLYLLDSDYFPERLRDHGCEIIGGLGLLFAVESVVNQKKWRQYEPHMRRILDAVVARGTNEDGMMYNKLAARPGEQTGPLSDGWGYNYVGYLCYDMASGTDHYREQVATTLRNLRKPLYKDYPWEGTSIDGFADSIEGGIYLLNRIREPEGLAWVDREMAKHVVRSYEPLSAAELWGTMKLEANGVRTTIMHALMHTQGLVARPWRQDLTLGAAAMPDGGIAVRMTCDEPWQGKLVFDIPRHRAYMGFTKDWPRMNTLPEWFTVETERHYRVRDLSHRTEETHTGGQLHQGLDVQAQPREELRITVS